MKLRKKEIRDKKKADLLAKQKADEKISGKKAVPKVLEEDDLDLG